MHNYGAMKIPHRPNALGEASTGGTRGGMGMAASRHLGPPGLTARWIFVTSGKDHVGSAELGDMRQEDAVARGVVGD